MGESQIAKTGIFPVAALKEFKLKLLAWVSQFEEVCFLDHNSYKGYKHHDFECLAGVGTTKQLLAGERSAFTELKNFVAGEKDWYFGYLTYDLKNDVEALQSSNFDGIAFPAIHFFRPQYVFELYADRVIIHSKVEDPQQVFRIINGFSQGLLQLRIPHPIQLQPRIPKTSYLESVQAIRQHIQRGDIYEMNFCQEFFSENAQIPAPAVFQKLNEISKAPFSAFYRLGGKYLLCASPERFLKKAGTKLISQPIKGTMRRGRTQAEDVVLGEQLFYSAKDRSENVMIVDLVRNDLARSCEAGTVQVEELYGIYRFEQVMQMVSAITGRLRSEVHFIDAIKNAFPMGSMTGAPKVRSMQLIEQYEQTKRGLYSGAVGYISPDQDFDFNVVIRSILYNEIEKYLSIQVGGAIVYDSEPVMEYEECLLKAKGMFQVLN